MNSAVNETQSLSSAASDSDTALDEAVVGLTLGVPREGPRRLLNVALAATMLVIALPVMVLIAIVIKLTSRGPVFYTQTRIGLNTRLSRDLPTRLGRRRACDLGGRPFVIYKFRTMREDAERESGAVWARRNDPR